MNGIINVLKPPGLTSHDVVSRVRRMVPGHRAGHTGTLDPGATGVLPVCIGKATRLTQYLLSADKEYRAEVMFNAASTTEDWTGDVESASAPVDLTRDSVAGAVDSFRGDQKQVPPMLSAVREGGRRLYELHRRGEVVQRKARPISIYRIELVWFEPGPYPLALLEVVCSRGTYIRSLAADIGRALGTSALLNYLVRTRVGPFLLETAHTLEELSALKEEERLADAVLPGVAAVAELRTIRVDRAWSARIRNGIQPGLALEELHPDDISPGERLTVLDCDNRLAAVVEAFTGEDNRLRLRLRQVFDEDI